MMEGRHETLVAEAMTSPVLTVVPETPIGEVARILVDNGISGLPVVDAVGRLLGVITEADLMPKGEDSLIKPTERFESADGARRRAKREAITARDAMTAGGISVDPACTLRDAARIMDARRLRRLLVVDEDDGLVGIVSRRDVVREFTRDDGQVRAEIIHALGLELGILGVRVKVSVSDGVVDLTGLVRSATDRARGRQVAAATRGVVAVRDHLRVDDRPAPSLPGHSRSSD